VSRRGGSTEKCFKPRVAVGETSKYVIVTVELPGVTKEDLNLAIEDGVLCISGTKRIVEIPGAHNVKWWQCDRRFGCFQREVRIPEGLTEENAEVCCKHGVLTICFKRAFEGAGHGMKQKKMNKKKKQPGFLEGDVSD